MSSTLKALAKQLFGARYERLGQSLLSCAILFFSLNAAGLRLTVAPFILYLTSTVFTACVIWQSLHSRRQAEALLGVLMLPFANRTLVFSYTLIMGGYTLCTKTLPVWALFLAVGTWHMSELAIALLCAVNACLFAAAAYVLAQRTALLPFAWGAAMLWVILILRHAAAVAAMSLFSLAAAALVLGRANAYVFYPSAPAAKSAQHRSSKGSVIVYFLRYLLANRHYLLNTAGLGMIACFLPLLLGQFQGLNVLPMGLALLTLNTPISTLLSSDADLDQAIRALPRQALRFGSRYGLMICVIHLCLMALYLGSWQLLIGGVGLVSLSAAALLALQSALLSVVLEWVYPIRHWKTESDLWHHPRKYLVPLLMLVLAMFFCVWPTAPILWAGLLLIQGSALTHLLRKP